MELNFCTLEKLHYDKVWEIFLEGFIDNHYFTDILPVKADRLAMFDRVYAPSVDYCINSGASCGVFVDGKLAGYNLVALYNDTTENEFNNIFFDTFIEAGEKEVETLRKRFQTTHLTYDSIAYFLIGVIAKKFRGNGLGKKMNRHVVDIYSDMPVMAELTSDGILAIYDKITQGRTVIQEPLTDSYVITTILPDK